MADLIILNSWKPHWDAYNPWRDHLIYVSIEDLAECYLPMTGPDLLIPQIESWNMIEAIANWTQYGTELDAYILTGPVLAAGVRYGPEGEHYLSPPFSLPKLVALHERHRSRVANTKLINELPAPSA